MAPIGLFLQEARFCRLLLQSSLQNAGCVFVF
jgi:hypothetical protein